MAKDSNNRIYSIILSAVIGTVLTTALTVGGFAVTSYINLRSALDVASGRILVLESLHPRDEAFIAETRNSLDKISVQITELRLIIARGGKK